MLFKPKSLLIHFVKLQKSPHILPQSVTQTHPICTSHPICWTCLYAAGRLSSWWWNQNEFFQQEKKELKRSGGTDGDIRAESVERVDWNESTNGLKWRRGWEWAQLDSCVWPPSRLPHMKLKRSRFPGARTLPQALSGGLLLGNVCTDRYYCCQLKHRDELLHPLL